MIGLHAGVDGTRSYIISLKWRTISQVNLSAWKKNGKEVQNDLYDILYCQTYDRLDNNWNKVLCWELVVSWRSRTLCSNLKEAI